MSASKSAAPDAAPAVYNNFNRLEEEGAALGAALKTGSLSSGDENRRKTKGLYDDSANGCRRVPHIPLNPLTCAHTHTHARAVGPLKENAAPCGTAAPSLRRCNLLDLAQRVARLGPDRRNPEQFHIDKSEIVAELRRLARRKAVAP